MQKVERGKGQGGQCKYINDDIGMTNDTMGTVITSLRYERGKTQGPIHGQDPSTLESLPLTEASPRSRQKPDPQPLHRIASLGSGHNKDCLRYRPTEHTTPSTRQIQRTADRVPLWRAIRNKPELTRGNGASAEKEEGVR